MDSLFIRTDIICSAQKKRRKVVTDGPKRTKQFQLVMLMVSVFRMSEFVYSDELLVTQTYNHDINQRAILRSVIYHLHSTKQLKGNILKGKMSAVPLDSCGQKFLKWVTWKQHFKVTKLLPSKTFETCGAVQPWEHGCGCFSQKRPNIESQKSIIIRQQTRAVSTFRCH